ncbi:MAG: NAD(P)H-dependent dehydrogenase/reductase [Flexistipes sinusarabici]|uniref:NAD(P)H-dependent dehydrogenase/reductase n=1 Tax=Flexistipes sinusarabici TaxID=2352 RepID=A0A5D0MN32_FLESI|nr:nitroreductase family protein [Flexistipes sinusarabici]TYB33335.1 MAG: NAD(P)H-dependent dehydrogenase/reductase [Flexistipes sinusarabici]
MIELLRKRRSIRKFQDKSIELEKIKILKEAALRAPTSRNIMPWEFIFVTDKNILKKLSEAKQHGSAFVAGAALAVVVCADTTKSDVWVEDCSIASIILQLTGLEMELGSCWVQIRNRKHNESESAEEYIQRLLGIPEHFAVESIIALGYPAEEKEPIPHSSLPLEKIHSERF